MKVKRALHLALCLFLISSISRGENPTSSEDGEGEMNGIAYKDYIGFENVYKLVTVRYRTDTGEMRFTYANDVAYKALLENSTDYPDGAVFTKIGIATNEDFAFRSSKVPGGARRVQFMVRDHKRYNSTGGWGYALFGPRGRTFMNDPKSDPIACYACHKIVPERGQVFSQPMTLSTSVTDFTKNKAINSKSRFKYKTISVKTLPQQAQELFKSSIKDVRLLEGEITKYAFAGTLDEIKPELIAEALKSNAPAIFLSLDKTKISIIGSSDHMKRTQFPKCAANEKAFVAYWTVPTKKTYQDHAFCASVTP
jgi:hypothetical protein